MCLCLDLCEGLCVCIFLRSPKAVVSDTCCWSFFPHLWAPMGDPFTPPKLSKEVINVSYSDDIHGTNKTGSHWNPLSLPFMVLFQPCVFFFWSFFPHFYMVMGDPTTQPKLLTTNVLYLGHTSMMFMNKKPRQIHYKSIASGI